MKKLSPVFGQGTRLLVAMVAMLAAQPVRGAGPFTVNTPSDTHAVSAASSPNDSDGHISLRSAVEAANAQLGATTINVPAGTYHLTLGEIGIAEIGRASCRERV